jgi:hypothetical protein
LLSRVSILILFVSSFFLSACSSMPSRDMRENAQFTTEIQSDGSKQFLLSVSHRQEFKGKLNRQAEREQRDVPIDREQGRERQGDSDRSGRADSYQTDSASVSGLNSNKRKMIIYLVESKLAESGYCRKGYFELAYSQLLQETEFKGECQEGASAEDTKRWG